MRKEEIKQVFSNINAHINPGAYYSGADVQEILQEVEEEMLGERKERLINLFNEASENSLDELDFFMELDEEGFTLEDIEKYCPEKYEYSKSFMEEHGLV